MKFKGTSSLGVQVEKEFSPETYQDWHEYVDDVRAFINRWEVSGDPLVEYSMEENVSVLD
jgi:hypothetical protein